MAIWIEATRVGGPEDSVAVYEFGFLGDPVGRLGIDLARREVILLETLDAARCAGTFRRIVRAFEPHLERGEVPDTVVYKA